MYIPHSHEDVSKTLSKLGLNVLEELFSHIEPELMNPPVGLPPPKSEEELRRYFEELSKHNKRLISFAGAGAYDRIVPSVVWQILSRGEFLTAYTPYQAEASQGTLQALFEYQTLICELTGMEVANASMYDGASAGAEAVLMARAIKGKGNRVLVSKTVNPLYFEVLKTYLQGYGDEVSLIGWSKEGTIDLNRLEEELKKGEVHALLVQYPNFFGYIEPLEEICELKDRYEVPLVVIADPVALSVLEPPGSFGAEIVVGEGQQLGIPLNFGGPYVGFFSTRKEYVRKIPGRLVGVAEDVEWKRAFTLVLQTREQHIRRERATSNICTNQNLLALANLVYLTLLGKEGLKEVAVQSLSKAVYLKRGLLKLGFEETFGGKHLWEYPLKHKDLYRIRSKMIERGYLFGVELGRWNRELEGWVLLATTEKRTVSDINSLLQNLEELLK